MKLSVIIISWNTCKLTLRCLKSIFNYVKNIDYEVLLVDNNSSDGTVGAVEEFKKSVTPTFRSDNHESVTQVFSARGGSAFGGRPDNLHIIKNQENLGFAKANNLAIRQAKGDCVLLLNSDTEIVGHSRHLLELKKKLPPPVIKSHRLFITPLGQGGIKSMLDFMEAHSEVGVLGPKLLNSDGTPQRSCRRFPTLLDQLFIQLKFYNFFPDKIKWTRNYFMLDFNHNEIREVDQVMGAAMFVRREVFEKIGLLDENFWAVFEEVDFCQRAKDAGFKICFYPDWQIIHHKEQSFKQWNTLRKQINFNRSLYYYFRKHKPFWQFIILWLVQPVNLFLILIDEVIGIRKIFGKKKDL